MTDEATCERLERLERLHEDLRHSVESTDPKDPGLALRMDRHERAFEALMARLNSVVSWMKWLLGGGLLGVATTAAYVVRLIRALESAGVP